MMVARRKNLKDMRVWVTGASSGIGRAVSLELARRGCRVAISARRADELEKVAAEAGADRILAVPLDVTDRAANIKAANTIQRQWGGLDIALLNAGTCKYIKVKNFDSGIVEEQMRSNFLSMAYGIEAALPLLRLSKRPHLVGMSSTAVYGGLPRAEAYGSSKAAIRYMLESLRVDLFRERITVSVICPGFVRTPLTDRNDFPMPMLVEVDAAARIIVNGIERELPEIYFPRVFGLAFKLLALLPDRLYARLFSRMM